MLPYLHFTPGDTLWFSGFVPISAGAMVGTCIGMFLLGLVDRWIAVCASVMGSYWDSRAQISQSHNHPIVNASNSSSSARSLLSFRGLRSSTRYTASHDLPRGIVHAGQSALEFTLMLGVMTFNIGFILSILLGLGVGEMLFGRFAVRSHIL